jgi:hypothetical protein
MNNLLAKHRLKILQHPKDNSLVYQEVIQEDAAKCDSVHMTFHLCMRRSYSMRNCEDVTFWCRLKGLSAEDLLVYQYISQAGNNGELGLAQR